MKIKVKGKETDIPILFIVIYLIALLVWTVIPIILNSIKIEDSWFVFWGNYLGAVIGALTTIIAFTFTYSLNKKQNEEVLKQNKEQNESLRKDEEERMRLKALPFLNAENVDGRKIYKLLLLDSDGNPIKDDGSNDWIIGCFSIENIGVAPAIDVKITKYKIDIGHFSVSSSKEILVKFPRLTPYIDQLPITYSDRENRKYSQKLNFTPHNGLMLVSKITPPELIEDNNEKPYIIDLTK